MALCTSMMDNKGYLAFGETTRGVLQIQTGGSFRSIDEREETLRRTARELCEMLKVEEVRE
jgi:hypothetical protein